MIIKETSTHYDLARIGMRSGLLLVAQERIFFTRNDKAQDIRKVSENLSITNSSGGLSISISKEIREGEHLSIYTAAGAYKQTMYVQAYDSTTGEIDLINLSPEDTVPITGDLVMLPADEVIDPGIPAPINPKAHPLLLMAASAAPVEDNLHFQSIDGSFMKFFF